MTSAAQKITKGSQLATIFATVSLVLKLKITAIAQLHFRRNSLKISFPELIKMGQISISTQYDSTCRVFIMLYWGKISNTK